MELGLGGLGLGLGLDNKSESKFQGSIHETFPLHEFFDVGTHKLELRAFHQSQNVQKRQVDLRDCLLMFCYGSRAKK